jgi:hypothetical protein
MQVSALVVDRRMRGPRPGQARPRPALRALLDEQIARGVFAGRDGGQATGKPRERSVTAVEAVEAGGGFGVTSRAVPPDPEPAGETLSGRFASRRGWDGDEAELGPRMRRHTLEHLSRSVALARAGDLHGARIHAELAESSLETAGRYLDESQYQAFVAEVERRLRGSPPAADAGDGGAP